MMKRKTQVPAQTSWRFSGENLSGNLRRPR
jgi:hypothetical protein